MTASLPADASPDQPLAYPPTRKGEQVDDYHGTPVADPYRWLEDDMSDETGAWVAAQNALTFSYLERIPYRAPLRERLTALVNYPRVSAPDVKRQWRLFAKNDGLQNQAVYYLQEGDDGTPRVLLDPNTMSKDGTTRVAGLTFDGAGHRLAYMVSSAGSDWQQIRVLDLASGAELPDRIDWVKVSAIAWFGDGFFYSRYPTPDETASAYSSMNEDHQVFYHALGTPQSADRLVYHDPANPQRFHQVVTTEDERFAVLYISDRGKGKDGTALSVMDLTASDQPLHEGGFRPLWTTFDDDMSVLDNIGRRLLVATNRHAPNRRVILIDIDAPDESHWTTVLPERAEPLDAVTTAGGRLFALYLKDVTTRVSVFQLDGTAEREVVLPGLGTAIGFHGEREATSVYYTFTSFTAPATVYRLDIASGASTLHHAVTLPFDPTQFETTQVFVTSKDGTRVPAFIVARKGLVLDGNNPTLVYAYGGFNVPLPPSFSAMRVAFLEQGGVYVQANLRGGSEYGEAWHRAGMKEHKQNVFDDGIAVCEWLIANGYTRPRSAGDPGRVERRLARGRDHDPAPRARARRAALGGRARHAAIPQVHHRVELDRRLRFGRRAGWLSLPLRLLAAAPPAGRRALPRNAHHDRRSRRPRGARAFVQVRRPPAGRARRRPPGAHPHRDAIRARQLVAHQEHRGSDRRVCVPLPQPRGHPAVPAAGRAGRVIATRRMSRACRYRSARSSSAVNCVVRDAVAARTRATSAAETADAVLPQLDRTWVNTAAISSSLSGAVVP